MNNHPKFQGFPLTRKPSKKEFITDVALIAASVLAFYLILKIGSLAGI